MLKKLYCNRREQTSSSVQAKYIQDFLSLFVWDDGIAVRTTELDFRVELWVSLRTLVMRVETRICLYVKCPLCLSDFNRN